ncbi:MAG: hypothetical protein MJ148_03825 [Clostridia bacterium]|nr:hypothetical protein [Clostridia bacterium]
MNENTNSKIKEQLLRMISSGRMAGAVLFVGGSKESRKEIAMWLMEKVLCKDELSLRKFHHQNHEDFIYLTKPEDKETIVVSQIEELIDRLSLKPYGDTYGVLIEDFHLAREAAQNKLLKTLEEPQTESVIVLLSERLDAVLPTIKSRCLSFVLEEEAIEGRTEEEAAKAFTKAIKAKAAYYKKKEILMDILSDKDNSRERALEFLDILEEELEKELLKGEDTVLLSGAIRQAETSRAYLKQVHSVAYTLKQMCLRV